MVKGKIILSQVSTRYGAPMGRVGSDVSGKCRLQLMEMCSCCGCYDKGGAYWGAGNAKIGRMYVCEDEDGNQCYTRATSREKAKQHVKQWNENVTFYR